MAGARLERGAILRSAARKLALVALAIAAGLALEQLLEARLESLDQLAHRSYADRLEARAEAARMFELLGTAVFGATAAFGVGMIAACRRSLALLQFPPPGRWSWGRPATLTGPRARTAARIGIGLAVALILASCAGGGLLWYMAAVLRACKR